VVVVALLYAILAGAFFPGLSVAEERPPNIVIILADDMGYGDVGYQGAPDIPTPNIDRLAAESVRFTDGYVSCAICSPTRAGLLTGRYQNRFGFETNPGPIPPQRERVGMATTEVTLAQMLESAGYATGMVGKWHIGMQKKHHPLNRGFGEFFGFLHGAHSYLDASRGDPILDGTKPVRFKDYLTDVFTREAVAFIEAHKGQPFFLYLPYNAVHTPLEATEEYLDRVAGIEDRDRRTYAAMTVALDDGVGRVVEALETAGLTRNTLLFFLSDNGGTRAVGRNLPLRGFKSTYWEGGIRVPFCVRWPEKLPAGDVYREPVISLDIVPTAVAAAGATLPDDRRIDGVNLVPYLTGERTTPPHEILFWRMFDRQAVRKGDWKLVRMEGGVEELFNLAEDLGETNDLSTERPEVLRELARAFDEWSAAMAEPLWTYPTPEEIRAYRRSRRPGRR
jgi:arylsulfatase A-like enzyme